MHITGDMLSGFISATGCFVLFLFFTIWGTAIWRKNDDTLLPFVIPCLSSGSIFGIICIILVKELLAKLSS